MLKFNNKVILSPNGKWIDKDYDPYNPLKLPPYTIRCKFTSGYTPVIGDSQTLVDAQDNIWDITKNSTDWWALFNGTQNYLLEVLGANTTGVTNMKKMFYNSKLLTTVALFDTTSVTDMSEMFYSCKVLTTVPLFDTHNVSNMAAMFDTCIALTYIPLFDTSSVTDMHQMFNACQTLTTVPLFNTSRVTTMAYMFDLCSSLTTVPLFNTVKVTAMNAMFTSCSSLTAIPLFNTSRVTTMAYMFDSCINVESGALALYQQASTQATPPSSHGYAFHDCGSNTTTGAAELAQIPSDWK